MKIPECTHRDLPRLRVRILYPGGEKKDVELCRLCAGVLHINMYQQAVNRRYRLILNTERPAP